MRDLERLGQDARRELARFEAAPGLVELVDAWPRVVGAEIARNAWPARLARDGTLHVATTSSTWAFELTHLESELLARLSEALGAGVPKKLRFAPGPVPASGAEDPGETARREPLVVGAEARSQAASLAAEIEDEELRKAVAGAAAASLERAAADRIF
jgi:hypothetical protein